MSAIDIKELNRIEKCLSQEEGWRLERKSQRVLIAYPPDSAEPPLRLVTSETKTARNCYVRLRKWGLDLEPTRGSGKPRKNAAPVKPAHKPKPAPVSAPAVAKAPPILESVPDSVHEWHLTDHALQRAQERNISFAEVMSVIAGPDVVKPNWRNPAERCLTKGDVQLLVDPRTKSIITIIDRAESHRTEPRPTPVCAPAPVPPPKPTPAPPRSRVTSDRDIRAITSRIRAASKRSPGRREEDWSPRNAATPDPMLPIAVMTPALASWLSDVVIRRLQSTPEKWASILVVDDQLLARPLADLIKSRIPELEITVCRGKLYARWRKTA